MSFLRRNLTIDISSEFSNPTKCSVTFIFPTIKCSVTFICKNIEEIVFEANIQQLLSQTLLKTANTANSQDIKLKNSINLKYVPKCIFPLSTRD